VNSDPVGKPSIDARRRFVDMASAEIHEADGESADAWLVKAPGCAKLIPRGTLKPGATVNPDVIGPIDKNVSDS